MKEISIKISALIFFAMVIAGVVADHEMPTIAWRSIVGAIIGYFASYYGMRLAILVMADAVVNMPGTTVKVTDVKSESENENDDSQKSSQVQQDASESDGDLDE